MAEICPVGVECYTSYRDKPMMLPGRPQIDIEIRLDRSNLLYVGYRIAQDQKSLLSCAYDGNVMTIERLFPHTAVIAGISEKEDHAYTERALKTRITHLVYCPATESRC
jgi:hypothetical protein